MALDFLMPLAVNQAGTASTTGGYLDLMKGTQVQASNQAGTDLLGPAGVNRPSLELAVFIQVSGSGSTPSGVFNLYQCDDTAAANQTLVGSTGAVTADGEYKIPLRGVTKRFLRLDYVKTTGTIPYNANVGQA